MLTLLLVLLTRAVQVAVLFSSRNDELTHARLIVCDEQAAPLSPHYLMPNWDNFIYFMTALYLEPE